VDTAGASLEELQGLGVLDHPDKAPIRNWRSPVPKCATSRLASKPDVTPGAVCRAGGQVGLNEPPHAGIGGNIESHPSESNSSNCPSGSRIIAIASVTVPSTTAPPNSATFSNAAARSETDNEICVSPI
jgi:hypothetical protein